MIILSGTAISKALIEVLIQPDQIKVYNRLLDGSQHQQSIGDALTKISVTFLTDQNGKNLLDQHYTQDIPITLNWYNDIYTGLIDGVVSYSYYIKGPESRRVYEVSLTIVKGD